MENEVTKADTKFDWLNTFFDQVKSMDCFKGPLGSHKNYIAHIALQNCVDYSVLVKSNRENNKRSSSDKYKELRYFLNAVESLNNILDYMYFEAAESKDISRLNCRKFISAFCKKHPFQGQIKKISNAYKHCICGKDKNGGFVRKGDALHACDLARNEIYIAVEMEVGRPLVEVTHAFEGINGEDLIGQAFRFWREYINSDEEHLCK